MFNASIELIVCPSAEWDLRGAAAVAEGREDQRDAERGPSGLYGRRWTQRLDRCVRIVLACLYFMTEACERSEPTWWQGEMWIESVLNEYSTLLYCTTVGQRWPRRRWASRWAPAPTWPSPPRRLCSCATTSRTSWPPWRSRAPLCAESNWTSRPLSSTTSSRCPSLPVHCRRHWYNVQYSCLLVHSDWIVRLNAFWFFLASNRMLP